MRDRIYVAGHRGMVGSALVRKLRARDADILMRSRAELDLTDQRAVRTFMQEERPDAVILSAARVGGIHANNTYPAGFIYENLMIEANVIHEAFRAGVRRLVFLGSSCIYPRDAAQPMREDALLSGPLEPTNEPYACAKIAGIKLCESYNREHGTDFRSVMPTNLYGPGDNFHRENSHVVPALLRRFHEAQRAGEQEVSVWGTGAARREFLHVDDMADATLFVMNLPEARWRGATSPMSSHINVGSGREITIGDLALLIAKITGYGGNIRFDVTKPDGAPRKLLDVSRLSNLGWSSKIELIDGLRDSYQHFVEREMIVRDS